MIIVVMRVLVSSRMGAAATVLREGLVVGASLRSVVGYDAHLDPYFLLCVGIESIGKSLVFSLGK